ncbi:MAG: serine hydrolase domain-containing protein [Alphaproteobacteria bacterium]
MTDLLLRSFQNRKLPAAAAVVVQGDAVSYVAFGKDADGRKMTSGSRFYIGSLSKAFTAAAVLQLVEQGRIDLDAPVQRYLREFRLADPRGAAITVRHLLNQTSGLADVGFQQWASPQPSALKDVAPRLAKVRLVSAPGAHFNYHNPNYEILARLVEVVSGQPFTDYMRDHVFLPLGMADTFTVDVQDEQRDGAPRGHIYAFGHYFAVPTPRYFINGAGGVVTTPQDYSRWLIAQMREGVGPDGVRVLSADSVRLSHTPSPTSGEYGFGWNRRGDRVSHSGGLPTYGAYSAMQGDAAIAMFVPVVSVAAPSREIVLGALDRLEGKTVEPIGADGMWWIDYVAATLVVLMWASAFRAIVTVGTWVRRTAAKPVWLRVVAFLPHALIAVGVAWGVPFLVSRVQSWSWLWFASYIPVWTFALWSAVAAAALVAIGRLVGQFGVKPEAALSDRG